MAWKNIFFYVVGMERMGRGGGVVALAAAAVLLLLC